MIGFVVDVEFTWGFQARIAGLSKTSPSFYYPPPTTFLGALAEAIAKDYRIGENRGREVISKLSENLVAVGWRPLNCMPLKYSDINRIVTIKITSGIQCPHPQYLHKSFDSPARGKTILSSLDGNAPKIRWVVVFKEKNIKISEDVTLNENFFWKIHRLGSKEGRVAVVDVEKKDVKMKRGVVTTNYSFPVDVGVREIDKSGKWEFEVYINPFRVKYTTDANPLVNYLSGKNAIPFRIPILRHLEFPDYTVEVQGEYTAYALDGEVVIGRWLR